MQKVMLGVLLAAMGLTAACTTAAPVAVQSTSSSPTSSSPSPTLTVTSSPQATVTVLAGVPTNHVVTRVVQVPDVPGSSSSLATVFENAGTADSAAFYTDGGLFFDAPSQNIGCYLGNDGTVACAIHNYDFPQNGPDCNAGIAATLDGLGSPSLTDCSGYFPVAYRGSVLPYGLALQNGNVGCVSESFGISCLNTITDTGFTISKAAFSPVY